LFEHLLVRALEQGGFRIRVIAFNAMRLFVEVSHHLMLPVLLYPGVAGVPYDREHPGAAIYAAKTAEEL
jgi:hypothetical protein